MSTEQIFAHIKPLQRKRDIDVILEIALSLAPTFSRRAGVCTRYQKIVADPVKPFEMKGENFGEFANTKAFRRGTPSMTLVTGMEIVMVGTR